MQLGLFNLMTLRDHPDGALGVMRDTRKMVETAEELDFDIAWFAEHHFANYSSSPSPLMMCSYAAGWTKKIKLGPGVIVLPLYNPLRVAQEIAVADTQSGGRLVIGMGTGYQQYEFDRYSVVLDDKVDIFLEYWDIIEQALVNGTVEYNGKFISVPKTSFAIKTEQKPLPSIFVTSSHPKLLSRFKKWGATPFIAASTLGSPALYKMGDGLNKAWESIGDDPATKPLAIMQYVNITDSRAEALEAGERARYVGRMAHFLRQPELPLDQAGFIRNEPYSGEFTLEQYADNMVVGDPHTVAEKIVDNIKRLNPSNYTCNFSFGCMPLERAQKSIYRFKKEVLPLVEQAVGPIANIGAQEIAQRKAG
ncbi:luciferase [Agrobacterium sp. 13-626]|uniref:LLM class flavin-dependent oxidoreductase n=1 Tax=Rhizobium rhizogenes TaxID=359 RepID=UPI0004D41DEE|nr:LLM class flavin-dependent oxidoreductase [Rhizobium rhizogenes]OCI93413.1 luciferase [Agrobacterium sp. 13-626]KEA03634.1 luciferase [Rhizobium rhizogenes]MQB33012.1 LLM class flavin-dependent oxidoreductase [Rhizobium rhizogenes]NTF70325.1 LLM class flavin-dependent oxidoreductase [Rhizobium rhizogenes]NTG43198.1 LLM class flavin-dependent oxidoreductase [Rhizobium rhizogenes]